MPNRTTARRRVTYDKVRATALLEDAKSPPSMTRQVGVPVEHTHLHLYERDFTSMLEHKVGFYGVDEADAAIAAARQLLVTKAKTYVERYDQTVVITGQLVDTVRIRPCTDPACAAEARAELLHDDR